MLDEAVDVLHMVARQTNGLVPLPKATWQRINDGRRLNAGHQTFDYGTASTNGAINRSYFVDSLRMLHNEVYNEFHLVHGRAIVAHELYATWLVGIPKMRALKWDVTKFSDRKIQEVKLKADMRRILDELRILRLSRNAPPQVPPLPESPQARSGIPVPNVPLRPDVKP